VGAAPGKREGTLYNLVGFQTKLKYGGSKRVFRMIHGIETRNLRASAGFSQTLHQQPAAARRRAAPEGRTALRFDGKKIPGSKAMSRARHRSYGGTLCRRRARDEALSPRPAVRAWGVLALYHGR